MASNCISEKLPVSSGLFGLSLQMSEAGGLWFLLQDDDSVRTAFEINSSEEVFELLKMIINKSEFSEDEAKILVNMINSKKV